MRLLAALSLSLAAAQAAPAQELTPEEAAAALAEGAARARTGYAGMSFEEFKAAVPYLDEVGKWVVNGDVPIRNEKLLREFFERNVTSEPPPAPEGVTEFAILNVGGLDQVWNDSVKRALTYCVSTGFGGRHTAVVADMAAAAAAWEAVADLDFVHVAAEDGQCTSANDRVVFDVQPMAQAGSLLAVAFFPNDPRADRSLRINATSFDLDPNDNLTLRGILRHELGHAIGARHEHTRPDAGTCFEDGDWRGVTDYDAFSVMHYPQCNGLGDWTLRLTESDKSGVACVYGAAAGFAVNPALVDPATCRGEVAAAPAVLTLGPATIARGETIGFDPIPVTPGDRFIARMHGEGDATGDPDLYLKFEAPALLTDFDCRPFSEGAEETCDVTVPEGVSVASVMVHGFADGAFRVEVSHAVSD